MRKQIVEYTTELDALIALVKTLKTYENRYQMESEEFFEQYSEGLLSDDEDFLEWSGNYQHFLAIRQELNTQLQNLQNVA
ncbi:antitoxin TumA [Dactylococcopsis salina]|uniref:Uncharacterized protein n=1 Tax=Dactylococcopsis salina (strain PCC 8305) TaxID=13035 RepID=K9YYA4_DACS8|nr:hypothetical protein [Dactylococcopsis salina]AFZ51093.1 hypothetical protein Dacsa_2502 [Dactylococcopsis salina PCC 8305]